MGQTPAGVVEEALAVEVPSDEGEEAVVTNSAGGVEGKRWEVSRATGFRPVVGAGWVVEVSSED